MLGQTTVQEDYALQRALAKKWQTLDDAVRDEHRESNKKIYNS